MTGKTSQEAGSTPVLLPARVAAVAPGRARIVLSALAVALVLGVLWALIATRSAAPPPPFAPLIVPQ